MSLPHNHCLGIDVGGTGMKAAVVDTVSGELLTERYKVLTPQPATLESMLSVLEHIVNHFHWRGQQVGCGFPSIIKENKVLSATNIDSGWIGFDLKRWFDTCLSTPMAYANDADVAAMAETIYGAGKDTKGTTLMITLGTGVGSGLVRDGRLIPNTELGQLIHQGNTWEKYMSNRVRKNDELSWEEWGKRLNEYLHHIDFVINPDRIIIGGGVSKRWEKYSQYIDAPVPVVKATLGNNAGIIGAAYIGQQIELNPKKMVSLA